MENMIVQPVIDLRLMAATAAYRYSTVAAMSLTTF